MNNSHNMSFSVYLRTRDISVLDWEFQLFVKLEPT